ncbi:putative HTH-type transcriptional regulator yusO [Proteiniborus sp. DW1]|uniref:MarR family winged helix-turn-helix transcriptional regulator n=1 Tax=Proteiniborus sp. DW1 TaxID=1889883 RepID=UPI00092E0C96|nr:MarR family transcriptional regulator [Proteiniborus sp. DW1]SCG84294.1 putative HTH-type transcriptional regulator yusO [Proteiniborus sp. DW1]
MEYFHKDSLYYIFLEILKLHFYRTHVLFDEIGVYPGQPHLLFVLNKEDGLSQSEIATKLDVKPSTVTVMLRRMEKANLIRRYQDTEDQRVTRVYITDEGRETCNKAIKITQKLEEECFGNFTVEEKIILRRLFMQMRANLAAVNDKE